MLIGGGNTSVKALRRDFFGDEVELIFVKGSGWDLATIEAGGFAPVRLAPLLKMAEFAVEKVLSGEGTPVPPTAASLMVR